MMNKVTSQLRAYFPKMVRILRRPLQGMEQEPIQLWDGLTTVLLLILITIIQKLLWTGLTRSTQSFGEQLFSVLLAAAIGWGGLSLLFYFIGRLRKTNPEFSRVAAYTGVAALPLIITTCISILIIGAEFLFATHSEAEGWSQIQTLLGWVGIALGWPGYFSGLALHLSTGIKKSSAMIIALVMTIFFLLGWWLPAA